MDWTSFLEVTFNYGGVAALAVFALFMLRESYQQRLTEREDDRKRAERYFELYNNLTKGNTEAIRRNTEVFSRVLERLSNSR